MMTLSMFIHDSVGREGAALKYMNADKKTEEKHKAKRQVKKRKFKKIMQKLSQQSISILMSLNMTIK